jgi:acyl-CoA ligase (AMP-forming) (exosortase A-associated)
MRLDDLIGRGARQAPALVEKDVTLSYAALDARVTAVAGGLVARGVSRGDRVAIYLPKGIDAVVAAFAAARAGAVFVPINPVLKAAQVAHIVADSEPAVLLTTPERAAGIELSVPVLTKLPVAEEGVLPCGDDADLVAILYTSGSTGRPKGVMLSHANMTIGAASVAGYIGNRPDDRILCALPLSFDAGFSQITTAFESGACAVLLDYLLPRDVVKACERYGITGITAVPPLWMQVADLAWPGPVRERIRYVANTGGRMPVALSAKLRALFPDAKLYLMYGLTEAFRSTYLPPELAATHPESIGHAIPDAEVLVVRPDGSVTDDGEPGELVHVGPLVAQGYWRDPERTAARFRPAPAAAKTGKTGVWSGDTVVRDAEGLLYFVGRDDEMIKVSGNRLSPTEVEEAAYATGAVGEAAAFGVADERLGQAVTLFATPAAGIESTEAEATLRGRMAATVPSYMLPRTVHWREALPRNPNGKIDRAALKAEVGA